MFQTFRNIALLGLLVAGLAGCSQPIPAALKPLPAAAQKLLAEKGMTIDAPIFVRLFKAESVLEVWKQKPDGRFHLFKSYPICTWSGDLGPKVRQGDYQSPEGFYTIKPRQMNPNSNYHLAFNIGYPNKYDRANGHTGNFLMVHGNCKSAGCYAMTDALIEEIYILAREAFSGGQESFQVQALPFRMTDGNMLRHRLNSNYGFWRQLKAGYDYFEATHKVPSVSVCEKRYLVNVSFNGADPDPSAQCPAYTKLPVDAMPASERTDHADASAAKAPKQAASGSPAPVEEARPSGVAGFLRRSLSFD